MWSSWAWGHKMAVRRRGSTAARIAVASCGASMTMHSASSPSSQTLLSTSQVPPSREKVPDVTRWFTVIITTDPSQPSCRGAVAGAFSGCPGGLGALVGPAGLHPVAADGHRAPAGRVGLAAVDEEQAAFVIRARAQPAGAAAGQGVPGPG